MLLNQGLRMGYFLSADYSSSKAEFFSWSGRKFFLLAGLDLHAFRIEERVGKHRKGESPLFPEAVPDSRPDPSVRTIRTGRLSNRKRSRSIGPV